MSGRKSTPNNTFSSSKFYDKNVNTGDYRLLQVTIVYTIGYYMLLYVTTHYYRLLQVTAGYSTLYCLSAILILDVFMEIIVVGSLCWRLI